MHLPHASGARLANRGSREGDGAPGDVLPNTIWASWLRSRRYGLDTHFAPDCSPLCPHDYLRAREHSQLLLQHARPVMEALHGQIAGSGSVIVLTDPQGVILDCLGDADALPGEARHGLRPGVCWSEQAKGTNGMGTCLALGEPVHVHGAEHFLEANRCLTCAAAPILDPHGRLAGALDVTGECPSFHPHTMALVRFAGHEIEKQMFREVFGQAVRLHFHRRPEFVDSMCEGVIAFGMDGQVVACNRAACTELELPAERLRQMSFASLFRMPLERVIALGRTQVQLSLRDGTRVHARIGLPGAATARLQVPAPPAEGPDTSAPPATPHLAALCTGDPALAAAVSRIVRTLDSGLTILLQGETGTGKERLAQAIHRDSARRNGPFVAMNCAAIPEGLIESELFGYQEGAFTGARRQGARGKILQAHGGTLFLDEIGDMPAALQARLLRVLQERTVTPLGSARAQPVDVAVVCATHRRLKDMIAEGSFREDLYYRVNGIVINLPPLRARSDLAQVVALLLRDELGAPQARVGEEVLALFRSHPWPGNLRQLSNVLRAGVALSGGGVIRMEHLPEDFLEDAAAAAEESDDPGPAGALQDIELAAIRRAVGACGGNLSEAARRLCISRATLYRKLRA